MKAATDDEMATKFNEWAVLELMGHRKLAGLLSEQDIAGHGFLRLEIPGAPAKPAVHKERTADGWREVMNIKLPDGTGHDCDYFCEQGQPEIPPATQFYSPSAVYAITPTTERVARAMAAAHRYEPVQRFDLPQLAALPAPEETFS